MLNFQGRNILVTEDNERGMYYIFEVDSLFIHGESNTTILGDFSEINRKLILNAELKGDVKAIEKIPELNIDDREVLNLIFNKTKEDS